MQVQAPAVQLWAAQTPWLLPGSCLIAGLLHEGRAGWQKHCHGWWLLLCPVLHCHLSLPVVCSQQGVNQWGDVLVANEREPGRKSQRKQGWLLLLKEKGCQMCLKQLSERKMHSIEKMRSTQKQGRFPPCLLSSICADS